MPSRTYLLSFIFVLLSALPCTTAIGGWQTICILFNRLNGERSQANLKTNPDSPQVAPVSSSRRGVNEADHELVQAANKKKNLNEVTMTARKVRSTRSSAPAFLGGRRSCLDEDDLTCISFVGRSPFL